MDGANVATSTLELACPLLLQPGRFPPARVVTPSTAVVVARVRSGRLERGAGGWPGARAPLARRIVPTYPSVRSWRGEGRDCLSFSPPPALSPARRRASAEPRQAAPDKIGRLGGRGLNRARRAGHLLDAENAVSGNGSVAHVELLNKLSVTRDTAQRWSSPTRSLRRLGECHGRAPT
jgi:hypothetical protein